MELAPGEAVLAEWPARGGRTVLTDRRLLLLTHPRPIRRAVRWSVELDRVTDLVVRQIRGPRGRSIGFRGPLSGGRISTGGVDMTLGVWVDSVQVFLGTPNECSEVQRRIDDARTARCLAVHGRLLPYEPGPPTTEADPPPIPGGPTSAVPGRAATAGTSFLLFIAGVPLRDAIPSSARPMVLGSAGLPGFTFVRSIGGPEDGDLGPGQIYGDQAETARMVLEIARQCGASVRVVDVDRSGDDRGLVERVVGPNDALPILTRPDGARLSGSDSMTPVRVSRFLQGR